MTNRRRYVRAALYAVVPSLLLAGWLYLWANSHAVDTDDQNQTVALLKDLKQLDTDWSADVLRSHADLDLNYDALTLPLEHFGASLAQLRNRAAPLHDAALDAAVDRLATAVDTKATLVDAFKAQNSIYKNSLRYIPTAHRDLQAQMHGGDARLDFIVNQTLRYSAVPDGEAANPLRRDIAALRQQVGGMPHPLGDQVGNLLSHLDTLLRLRAQQVELLRAISQVPVVDDVDALAAVYTRRHDAEMAGQYRAQRLMLGYSAFVLLLVCSGTWFIFHRNITERRRLRTLVDEQTRELRELAIRDGLTRVYNRRHMDEMVRQLAAQHARSGAPLCIALLDIDLFKSINDRHGHGAGDTVLTRFAALASQTLREMDVLGRWGGEEFLIAFPNTSIDQAALALQRVRESLVRADFSDLGDPLKVSFSGGLVTLDKAEAHTAAIERADQAMYRAKSGGRDRVERG